MSPMSVFRAPHAKNEENICNPLIFLRKMAACSCFAGPIDIKHIQVCILCPFVSWLIIIRESGKSGGKPDFPFIRKWKYAVRKQKIEE